MRITKIKTLQLKKIPRVIWVVLETDEGISGLGETVAKPGVARAVIHEVCSSFLLGKNPLDIEWLWISMFRAFSSHGATGAEMRAISAIDIALWDILGKYTGQPIYRLLGGACRDKVKIYNTGLAMLASEKYSKKIYEQPGEPAKKLLELGIDVVKIAPFDRYSVKPFLGHYISPEDLKKGLEVVKRLREAIGDRMQIAIDMYSQFDVPAAIEIARALEPYDILWIEDPAMPDNAGAFAKVKAATNIRIAASERLHTRYAFRRICENQAADIIIADPCWAGGISETKKIASMAEVYELPFAPHNAGGPILHIVNSHLCINIPNLWMMESMRHNYQNFGEFVTPLPEIKNGYITPLEGPGLGAELKPELWEREDAIVDTTAEGEVRDPEAQVYKQAGFGASSPGG